jgi:hypothetical protein
LRIEETIDLAQPTFCYAVLAPPGGGCADDGYKAPFARALGTMSQWPGGQLVAISAQGRQVPLHL